MITHEIFSSQRLIIVRNIGEISLDDCKRCIKKIQADPAFSPDYDVITDVTASETIFTTEEIYEMADFSICLPKGNGKIKNAIIAPGALSYGMSRMFEMVSYGKNPYETMVFRDWTTALEWLGRESFAITGLYGDTCENKKGYQDTSSTIPG